MPHIRTLAAPEHAVPHLPYERPTRNPQFACLKHGGVKREQVRPTAMLNWVGRQIVLPNPEERIPGALHSPSLRPAGAGQSRWKVFNLSDFTLSESLAIISNDIQPNLAGYRDIASKMGLILAPLTGAGVAILPISPVSS